MPGGISQRLLAWYAQNARTLPWRGGTDAYAVWVSEIMLQQTRVDTVIPYFLRWMERFPDVASLAAASEEEVLRLWEGLGYYSRARNLHKTARLILAEYQGKFPADTALMRRLPGIGRYTAGAIASIAFGQNEPALDGNIRRVLARLYDVSLPEHSPEAEKRFLELAAGLLPPGRAGDFNQALMDLGAMVCTPRSPDCPACPLAALCTANQLGIQAQRPVREARKAVPHILVTAGVIRRGNSVVLARRLPGGLLGGMWEYPGGKCEPGETLPDCLKRELMEELGVSVNVGEELGVYEHAYTHLRVTLHTFVCTLEAGEPQALHASEIRWVRPHELADLPMGKIDRQISRRLLEN
jgi:A/G-specific adenine glycosylase